MWKALISILEKWGCKHSYKEVFRTRVTDDFGGSYTSLTYCCQGCGKFKKVKSH